MPLEEIGETTRSYKIYREPNEVGGHRYLSDAIGGGAVIWDTSIASIDELELAIDYEKKQNSVKLPYIEVENLKKGSPVFIDQRGQLRLCSADKTTIFIPDHAIFQNGSIIVSFEWYQEHIASRYILPKGDYDAVRT